MFPVLLFVLAAPVILIWNLFFRQRSTTRLPPGSLGWPIIGETLRFAAGSSFYDERVARYGALFKTSLFGSKTIVLPAPDGTRLALMNENKLVTISYPKSVSILLGRNSLISLRGDEHRRSKALLMTFLRPEMLQRFVNRACKVADEHLNKFWKGRESVRVYNLMKKFTFALACDLLMGLDVDGEEMDALAVEFDTLVRGLFQVPLDMPGTLFRKAKAARKKLDQRFDRHIEKKRQELLGRNDTDRETQQQDMLEVLLTTRDENEELSSDSAIKDNIVSLLFAGHDTSSTAMTWTFKFLAENPSCMHKVVQENLEVRKQRSSGLSWEDLRKLRYTWQVVQEAMRLQPPVGGGFREALIDLELDGYVIPKGWKLNWTPHTSYRKAEFFPEPHKFDPSRFDAVITPYTYLPFGAGARMCPGSEFAKMEILVFLHYCLPLFDWTVLEPHEAVVVDPMPRPVNGLPIKISRRRTEA